MKKFIAHQTAGTKAGRKLISNYVGENGCEIIEAVKSITTYLDGKETAKKNKEVLLLEYFRFCFEFFLV